MLLKSNNEFVTKCGPVRVLPGLNEIVDDQKVEYLLKSEPTFELRLKKGQFEIIGSESDEVNDEKKPSKKIASLTLSKVSQQKALKLVSEIFDRATIVKYLEIEKRPKVVTALESQLEQLNRDDEKNEDKGQE